MARPIGFSTGALAFGDFRRGLQMLRQRNVNVVELSALRDTELLPLVRSLGDLDLSGCEYISVHAPSSFHLLSEAEAARLLRSAVLPRRWPIILHPDAIMATSGWDGFGEWLCLENMDKRKSIGRTVGELQQVFERFPQASFCFDIGHARQVDPTMTQAALILNRFGNRLRQVHISEVDSRNQHEAISYTALRSFQKVAHLIPEDVPVVVETVIAEDQIER